MGATRDPMWPLRLETTMTVKVTHSAPFLVPHAPCLCHLRACLPVGVSRPSPVTLPQMPTAWPLCPQGNPSFPAGLRGSPSRAYPPPASQRPSTPPVFTTPSLTSPRPLQHPLCPRPHALAAACHPDPLHIPRRVLHPSLHRINRCPLPRPTHSPRLLAVCRTARWEADQACQPTQRPGRRRCLRAPGSGRHPSNCARG
ncbi:hypothetical protein C8Q78DRAFT_681060 [Trametes maxima]|nr:hypothetical protein C8Q78DRAFT_681060 [Trametes maxima]